MALRAIVVGVAAVLIVVSALAVVSGTPPAAGPRTSIGPAVAPAAGPIGVTALDQNGIAATVFFPGQTTGRVYFSIDDPALDANVTVHMYDTNAARDGLPNPVATWTVDVSSGTYVSTQTGLEYTLPTNLTYGGFWNVTASGALGGFASAEFSVQTYTLTLVSSPTAVLAGHSGTVEFLVTGIPSAAPYSVISSVQLTATYYDGTTAAAASLQLSASSFGAGVASGTASFLLPVNASHYGQISFEGWANVTSPNPYSVESSTYSDIGNFLDTRIAVQYNGVDNDIAANSLVQLTVTTRMVTYSYGAVTAPGVGVTFSFWSGPNRVANGSIPGNPPAALTTGLDGTATILFVASPSVFSTSAVDQVNVSTTSVPSVAGSAPVYYNQTYDFLLIGNGTAGATVVASFGAALYIGGDSGTATWNVLPANGGTTSGWSALGYQLSTYYSNSYNVLITGELYGLSGTINFTAPLNYSGTLYLAVAAHNQSTIIESTAVTQVVPAQLVVSPSEVAYNPGDTVRFVVETYGSLFAAATIYETIRSSSGAVLSSGVVANDTFSLRFPSTAAPPYITVEVSAQTSALGVFASSDQTLDEAAGITVSVGISTVSSYSDGSFQPGQALTVTWSESTFGPGLGALSYWVALWTTEPTFFEDETAAPVAMVLTNATSGSFSYVIPSGSVAGTRSLWVSISPTTPCQNYCENMGQVSFVVNPSPSVMNLELGAGSGVTVGWLILLIAIIVIAVVLFLVVRRGRSPKTKSLPAVEWKPVEPRTDDLPPPPPPPPPSEPQ